MNGLPIMPPPSGSGRPAAGDGQIAENTPATTGRDPKLERPEPAATRQGEGVETRASQAAPLPRGDFDEDIIRSAEQFLNTMNRHGSKGGTLRIAREADLELPATEFTGLGTWLIEAEPGPQRPRIRFRPSVFAARPPTAWAVLLNLRAGGLQIHGVDIMIPGQPAEASRSGPQAAIGVCAGTRLDLTDCTITVDGRPTATAAVVVQPAGAETGADKLPAVVKISDSFVRSAGDCLTAASGRLLDLQLKNVLVSTEGSLLHALGSSRIEGPGPHLKASIAHSLVCSRGGLVHLQSSLEETELPLTLVEASNSVFSTAGSSAPLLRVDGQGQGERHRDPIVYKADKVAYDQITTYRREQILQTGVSPRDYSRTDWRTAFDPQDDSAVTEGVKFLRKLGPRRPALSLTKDDLTLDPQSAAGDRGPTLSQIPAPPAPDS
jgi:eukaryotic-like serine/threonine-protein kinase